MNIKEIELLAKQIRIDSLQMCHDAKSSHIGSCLSCADILAVLYGSVLKINPNDPEWPERDRFILSKGHACAALYAVLAETGFFPKSRLQNFYQYGSYLTGHANHKVPGVEVSTGSLGDGLSIGCGMALANTNSKVYVLLSDGDCNEGSTWEAAMFAAHHNLSNLTVIVDHNKLQALGGVSQVLGLYSLSEKWESFGWYVAGMKGNDVKDMMGISYDSDINKPLCLIADTVKGKGVSFIESKVEWHYKYPNDEELKQALAELK